MQRKRIYFELSESAYRRLERLSRRARLGKGGLCRRWVEAMCALSQGRAPEGAGEEEVARMFAAYSEGMRWGEPPMASRRRKEPGLG